MKQIIKYKKEIYQTRKENSEDSLQKLNENEDKSNDSEFNLGNNKSIYESNNEPTNCYSYKK